MTEYTRQEIAWLAAEDGEPMDYGLHGIAAAPLSENQIRRIADDL